MKLLFCNSLCNVKILIGLFSHTNLNFYSNQEHIQYLLRMMEKHQRIRSKFDNVVKGMGDLTTYLAECHAMKFSDRVIISVRRTNSVASIECNYHGPLLQQIVSSGWLFIDSFILVKKIIIHWVGFRYPYYLIHHPSSPFYR